MAAGTWDIVESFFAERLLVKNQSANDAVVQTCRCFPLTSPHYLALALSSSASALKSEWISDSNSEVKKLISLHEAIIGLMIDMAALELSGKRAEVCADLLAYWANNNDQLFRVD